tara:strand:- start:114 stop:317 length:204 start_codon:yes stop_codon:yes gene_type:complete
MNTKTIAVVALLSIALTLCLHVASTINGMSQIYSVSMSLSAVVGILSIIAAIAIDTQKRRDLIASQA